MIRSDASALLKTLCTPEKKPTFSIILSDNEIFQSVLEQRVEQIEGSKPKLFAGQNGLENFVNSVATQDLFAPLKTSVLVFPEKLTQKNWNEAKKNLSRLPNPIEVSVTLFAPTRLKNILKEDDFPKDSLYYLCYEPSEQDLQKCAQVLFHRYEGLVKKYNKNEQAQLLSLALESYTHDLISCDMHFARMEKGQLSFSDALSGSPEVNGFHVAEALALRDKHLIELRLNQCAQSGEDASSVFMALVYFLKQIAFVQGALEQTKNLKSAFEQTKIPYPAQARLQKALSWMTSSHIVSFFSAAAQIEMEMRLQKNGHAYLSIELINWINYPK